MKGLTYLNTSILSNRHDFKHKVPLKHMRLEPTAVDFSVDDLLLRIAKLLMYGRCELMAC